MEEQYAWVDWFNELAGKVAGGSETDLADKARAVAWRDDGEPPQLLKYESENVDPFSFIYALAESCGGNLARRTRVARSVESVFDLQSKLPVATSDAFYFPQGYPGNLLFHYGGVGNPELLWRLFRDATQGLASVTPAGFDEALKVGNVGTKKLTQALHLIDARTFAPYDDSTRHLLANKLPDSTNWAGYLDMVDELRASFPGSELYEINLFAYLVTSGKVEMGGTTFQVSTNVFGDDGGDHWDEFVQSSVVRTGGQAPGVEFGAPPPSSGSYPLTLPSPGDLVLARTAGRGRGVGMVWRNEYRDSLTDASRIHVVWLNKVDGPPLNFALQRGFSRADNIEDAFRDCEVYRPTFAAIDRLRKPEPDDDPVPPSASDGGRDNLTAATGRYWLMALGPNATRWKDCYEQGIACIGWDHLGDLTQYASREETQLGMHSSLACWQFAQEMAPGDVIFVRLGTHGVVGHGTVTSAYRFEDEREHYKNIRDVAWHTNFPGGVFVREKRLVLKTLTDVTKYPQQVEQLRQAVRRGPESNPVLPPQPYTVESIATDGCFLASEEVEMLMGRLRNKKNLVLQGPPGTGKTWLAKRLAYALIGQRDRDRVSAIQFHPTLSYEDFVIGWRPSDGGKLALTPGIFLRAIEAAEEHPDAPFVVVIEEINRGNPAQIFGELITLLEADKRTADEAVELAYSEDGARPVHVPENLYVIGTMNIADRSLALVDLALRRRFAFATLEPQLGDSWLRWVSEKGVDAGLASDIQRRMSSLNDTIAKAPGLGDQFRVGHSYVTPSERLGEDVTKAWFRGVVETEIGPLLEEYWFDDADQARRVRDELLKDW